VFDGTEKLGIVHIELTMDSLRTEIVNNSGSATVRVLDPDTGAVILDSRFTQAATADLGQPDDHTFTGAIASMAQSGMRDLANDLPVEGFDDDRLRGLASSFETTIDRLRVLVGQAQSSSDQLTEAAAELNASSGQQADTAREQSAAVSETTVTIQQLAATA